MNTKFNTYKAILFFVILNFCLQNGCAKQSEFMKLVEARPAPDLETLAERSSPENDNDPNTTIEAFYDILKLRDIGDNKAVPVLEQIIKDDNYRGRIQSYAAAQALFCIGTPEANKVLSQYLLTPKYNASMGIRYIFAYEMDKTKQKGFIEQYHLKNLSKDMEIKLSAEKNKDENGQKQKLTITLTNISKDSFQIRDKQVYLADMIFLQSKNGEFIQWFQPVMYNMPMPKWIELTSGKSLQYNISLAVKPKGKQKLLYFGKNDHPIIFLESNDMICGLEKPGEFKFYAIVEQEPLSKESLDYWKLDNPWIGRAVSEPVTVKIP
jgi:hypothetical protein